MLETTIVVILLVGFAVLAFFGLRADAEQARREVQEMQRRRERNA